MNRAESHQRVNDILLGPLERPALQWLAARMPPWVNPDILTAIGIGGALLTFAGYALSPGAAGWLAVASLGLVINWFGDSLDGTLARFRHIERPRYGFFLDHTVDAVGQLLVVLGLGLSPLVRFELACLALIAYMLMTIFVYLRTVVDGVFQISYGKFGPTEVRALVILVNTAALIWGVPQFTVAGAAYSIFDGVVAAVALLLLLLFLWQSGRQAQALARLEPRF